MQEHLNDKYVDPRLQARERFFENIHLSVFDTMNYARAIQEEVESTGYDIEADNLDYQQLLRDYEVTKNLSPIRESLLEPLCQKTDELLHQGDHAYANYAQLCAAATSSLNHWRMLAEIPEDLRCEEGVTKPLKQQYRHYFQTWEYIISDMEKNK